MPNIDIPKPNIQTMEVTLYGTQPLICHKFSEKSRKMMEDIIAGKPSSRKPKTQQDIEEEYKESFYYNEKGQISFPALCIKNAIVGAGRFVNLPMTQIRGTIFVEGDNAGLLSIKYKTKVMRTDRVRVGRGGADIRYRGELRNWQIICNVKYNANFLSKEQVINLLETAGFSQGLGEWRPEREGTFGTFTLIKPETVS